MRQIHVITLVGLALVLFFAVAPNFDEAHQQNPSESKPEKASLADKPLTYRAEKSGVIFYVESDRQHVAAMDKDGKVLWHKNIIDQVHCKEILGRPARVTYIGKAHHWTLAVMKDNGKNGDYVGIALTTKHFGVLDQSNGVFTWMGND